MATFPIVFTYAGQGHTATVQRVGSGSVQYLVTQVEPAREHLPDPLILFADKANQKITYAVEHDKYPSEFGDAVVEAIFRECDERCIEKFGE